MKDNWILKNFELLADLKARKIYKVRRQLFLDDAQLNNYEQVADGPIEFSLSGGLVVHFVANTERMSLGIVKGEMPIYGDSYDLRDITCNQYWAHRANTEIGAISLNYIPGERVVDDIYFGIELEFVNNKKTFIQYKSDDEFLDAIFIDENFIVSSGMHKIRL